MEPKEEERLRVMLSPGSFVAGKLMRLINMPMACNGWSGPERRSIDDLKGGSGRLRVEEVSVIY